ncbi:S24 family peptidase [Campylobacter sp. RM16704]|uniref:S24 family peptidase n=1 Tax=Campylobacter sp. RM16704 TaxID=1500960 RepID=UPI00057D1D79|nr:S24 family peptidase [Campylobacter sp. RM16704]AJC86028.1 peptidase S24 LexA-like protein [Campylobacter sp. RM16704]
MEDFKTLVEDMKKFFNVTSLEMVAKKLGLEKSTAIGWRQRRRISAKAILKFNQLKYKQNNYIIQNNIIEQSEKTNDEDIISIPFYKDCFIVTDFTNNQNADIQKIPFNKKDLNSLFNLQGFFKIGIISMIGNSMEPTIKEGDMIIFQNDDSKIEGGIYIVEYQNEILVKRIKKRPLCLISDNKEYPIINIKEADKLKIIGRIIGTYAFNYKKL